MATLATEIRNVSGRRGDIETLLTGIIVESANLWVSDRKAVNTSLARALNMQPTKAGDDRILRIAAVMLANGCLLDKRLETIWQNGPRSLAQFTQDETIKSLLMRRWRQILDIDYKPIFEPALACLTALPDGPETEHVLETLRGAADSCADALGALEYDVAGPIYHRLLESARYDGSFYTTPPAAMLLARLALSHVSCDWNDPEAIAQLRIIDPACGTGTLLLAVQHAVRDLHAATTIERTSIELVHLEMVQRVLHGLDINRHAVQLAACNLTLSSPRVDYHRMPLYTAKHGLLREDGRDERAWAGSIELLMQDSPGQLALDLGQPKAEEEIETGHGESQQFGKDISEPFDLVIMNPPYTRNDIRNRQLTKEARKKVQQREQNIADLLKAQDKDAALAIDQTNAGGFFTPLADKILRKNGRTLATVKPTTMMANPSGRAERELLATRFHVETVITAHDPKRIYFSGNTSIHESLIVATSAKDEAAPTRFIQLHRNPTNKAEALALESCLRENRDLAEWGRESMWPAARMKRGDWRPALFYSPELMEAVDEIEAHMGARLRPLGDMAHVGPEGRRIRDAFSNDKSMTGNYAILWHHKTDRQKSIETTPDCRTHPKEGKEQYAARSLWPKAGRLLVGNKLWLSLTRTTAVWSKEPMLGSAWCPVTIMDGEDKQIEQAWAAWLNSTLGILGFLARRTKKLTYPAFPLESLRSLPCPNFKAVNLQPLIDAFEETKGATLEALPNMANDPARIEIDSAAARVARLDGLQVAKWRDAISREPSICNG